MKKKVNLINRLSVCFIFIIATFFIVATCGTSKITVTENISNVRSIQAVHLISRYDSKKVVSVKVDSFSEMLELAQSTSVKFSGTMTGYGPDCEGCGGKVGCPPRQNVKNGNVYFNDQEYGRINIVASDSRIPCGTIVKITDSSLGDEVVAIVLDRGGAIKGTLMDFLVETESYASKHIGRQKVTYEIVRWGW